MSEYQIGSAIKLLLGEKKMLRNGLRAVQIEEVWKDLMGVAISKYTRKIEIINETLFISTEVAVLKNELHFQREKIIERVNEALKEKVISKVVIQ